MPRLYLIILTLLFSFTALSQNKLGKYLEFAKEQYNKGDYYYALEYYKKAMEIDSQSVDILWNYAETLKAYKDYRTAELYYLKVYGREEAQIYPYSLLNAGLMQKMNGKYDEALETFKKAKKKYYKDKKGYLYQKSKREIASCVWAKSALVDTSDVVIESLPDEINTKNAEFGHMILDGHFIFSSLRADSISENEEVYTTEYSTFLYQSKITNGQYEQSEKIEDLFFDKMNTGNGTLSLDGKRYYFSLCSDEGYNYRCKIMVAYYENGVWSSIDSLGEIINEEGTNTTMPCIAELEGKEFLIFSSDRMDGKGGMDLYFSQITNGNQYGKVRAINTLNTMDNEVTPWWDHANGRLYFSSSWFDSFGGYDIFYSEFGPRGFEAPINAGLPVNSQANDLYYFAQNDTSYVSSNRIGVRYSKNPTCCSDIFALIPPLIIEPPSKEETLADLNKRLPVTLYFHNDIPNPRSWDTTTNVNYIEAYNDYTAMLDKYKSEYAKGLRGTKADEAKEDIESFFIEYVDKGVSDLYLFRDLLLKELDGGARINITVKGFASPLAKTDYNVHLTKRRIASLVNYLRRYNGGVFAKYLDDTAPNGGKVVFTQVPFGEYTANQLTSDNPNDVQNSVYSRGAAIERKIEIQSVSYLDDNKDLPVKITKPIIDLGEIKSGDIKTVTFEIKNLTNEVINLSEPKDFCPCMTIGLEARTIGPNEVLKFDVSFDSKGLKGHNVRSFKIFVDDFEQPLEFFVSSEVK